MFHALPTSPFSASPFPASTVLPPPPPQLHPGLVDRLRPPQVTLQALPSGGTLLSPSSLEAEFARQKSLFREVLAVLFDLIVRDNVNIDESDLAEFLHSVLLYRPGAVAEIAQQEGDFVLPPGMDNGRGGNMYLSPPQNGGKAWALALGILLQVLRRVKPPTEQSPLDPAKVLRLQQAIYQAGGPPPPSSSSHPPSPPSHPPSPPSPQSSSGGDWGGILVLGGLLALAASSK